ncbi:MAG: glycosyltransferase [Bacteroidetes bacterium]|nr:MAG: glycosyltransferase [Bacteroidota bacterium]
MSISIITITYNAEKFVERTIQSVISQTYSDIEYLIIDGNSKDNTLKIVEKYKDKISQIISEKDKGIYDAMNKGLRLAKNKYVLFMNAGDEIYAKDTLEKLFEKQKNADIYYGETLFLDIERNELGIRSEATPLLLPQKLTWKSLQMGLMVCHQAIIVKKEIADEYDLNHPFSADIDWVIKALKKAKTIVNAENIIAIYLQGGFSRKHLWRSLKDRFLILSKHYGFFITCFNHLRIIVRAILFIIKKRKTY